MKKLKPLVFFVMLAGIWLLASSDIAPASYYAPFYMDRDELRESVSYVPNKLEMKDPGKIWVNGDGTRIYVVERYLGVHVIDNSDPSSPVQTGFIIVPGCMDVAVKGNIIYMDNAIDLVAFDLDAKEVTHRLKDFFPEPISPDGRGRHYTTPANMVRVGWKKITR